MKHKLLIIGCASGVLAMWGAGATAAPLLTSTSLDSGGRCVTSANYAVDGSLGGIGGLSTNAGAAEITKHGYIGQLTEVTNLTITASPGSMNEGGTSQLDGVVGLDDATVVFVAGSNIAWGAAAHPVSSITAAGVATAAIVCSNTTGVVTGTCLGMTGTGTILVLDSNPDNWGIYASDQIPDGWQVAYFGLADAQGVAGATNVTGRSNLYTYTADLNPLDPEAAFEIVTISNQPPNKVVCFRTSSTARVYRLAYATNLVGAVWTNLPGATWVTGGAGGTALLDTNAPAIRFYRVEVQVP